MLVPRYISLKTIHLFNRLYLILGRLQPPFLIYLTSQLSWDYKPSAIRFPSVFFMLLEHSNTYELLHFDLALSYYIITRQEDQFW
jgi:hypothetical protein